MALALEGDVEKHSDVLGRNAVWRKTARVKKLPKYVSPRVSVSPSGGKRGAMCERREQRVEID
jgi:hypothetical protein